MTFDGFDQAMSYAKLAGLPPIYGLCEFYCEFIGMLLKYSYSWFKEMPNHVRFDSIL